MTGGAGFIGSNLVDRLIEDNDQVVVVDDLSMGLKSNLQTSSHLKFYEHSITDHELHKNLLMTEDFDYIYLLAAVASVADSVARPYETHQINQEANIFILEIIRKKKLQVKKILYTSSAAVYGNVQDLPKYETSLVDPLTPYAIDKFATERFVIDYGKLYDIPTVAVRFFLMCMALDKILNRLIREFYHWLHNQFCIDLRLLFLATVNKQEIMSIFKMLSRRYIC